MAFAKCNYQFAAHTRYEAPEILLYLGSVWILNDAVTKPRFWSRLSRYEPEFWSRLSRCEPWDIYLPRRLFLTNNPSLVRTATWIAYLLLHYWSWQSIMTYVLYVPGLDCVIDKRDRSDDLLSGQPAFSCNCPAALGSDVQLPCCWRLPMISFLERCLTFW